MSYVIRHTEAEAAPTAGDPRGRGVELAVDRAGGHQSRRDVMRHGVRLAFVAPAISTFLAHEAYAANYSCYPTGHACGTGHNEPCCTGSCNVFTDTCDP